MISRRSLIGMLGALFVSAGSAGATGGFVDRNGCHGRPKHCHSRSQLRKASNGRFFVPRSDKAGRRTKTNRKKRSR